MSENYHYSKKIRVNKKCSLSKKFWRSYKKKDVVATLEAMQKMDTLNLKKSIDKLKPRFTLTNLTGSCSHQSTRARFYRFAENDNQMPEKTAKTWLVDHQ